MADIVDYNYRLMNRADEHRRKGSKALLQTGRIVVLLDGVSFVVICFAFDTCVTRAVAF